MCFAALAWSADESGVDLYGFSILRGVWGAGTGYEGEPYQVGPISMGAVSIPFDVTFFG